VFCFGAIEASPLDAGLHHAQGLALTRLKRTNDAMTELRRAVELEPARARYAYVYGVVLNSAGRGDEAMTMFKEALAKHPQDRDILLALTVFSRDAADYSAALDHSERSARLVPNDSNVASLVKTLRRLVQKSDGH
jgi:Flp pilus assembly protein TadD